ncbi:DMT family transporter [Bifidobacterium scardovii]|uniref:DMT family transporter n=1 Tax=Bifidobacterium scardovii TaxID=158787 RepID=UPI00291B9D3D|nr:DMT family transporter [Bifidobacterium scardovii]MDU8982924.1 DMT family transporter [Bifidobacterium scardovii]
MQRKEILGLAALVMAAVIWGFAFVSQVQGMDSMSPLFFNAVRFTLGAISLLPVMALTRRRHRPADGGTRTDDSPASDLSVASSPAAGATTPWMTLAIGGACGVLLFTAGTLQQYGILYGRSAGHAGFITALYIVLIPLFGLFAHRRVTALTGVSVIVALAGFYLLCLGDGFEAINMGDLMVFLGSVCFALHILTIDTLGSRIDPVLLSFIQFAVTALLSWIGALADGSIDWRGAAEAWIPVLYAGFGSVGIAYTLQSVGQRFVPPTRAALALSLESFFSVVGGVILLSETMPMRGYIGCALIFAGTLMAQLPAKVPSFLRRPDRNKVL